MRMNHSMVRGIAAGALSATMLFAFAPAIGAVPAEAAPQSQAVSAKAASAGSSASDQKAAQGFLDLLDKVFPKQKVSKGDVAKLEKSWKALTKKQKLIVNSRMGGDASTVITEVSDRIKKKNNFKATVKGKTLVTIKYKNLKKKPQSFQVTVKKAKGKVTYFAMDAAEQAGIVEISKKGKVTFKKGTPKGEYEIVATDSGNKTYKSQSQSIAVVIK